MEVQLGTSKRKAEASNEQEANVRNVKWNEANGS